MSPAPTPSTETMTTRERIYATIRGEEVDRFPVWLKMTNRTWQNPQPEPYRSMDGEELLRACGCDLMLGNGFGAQKNSPHVTESRSEADGERTHVWSTPEGDLVGVESYDPYTQSWHPTTFPAESTDDLRKLRWVFRDTSYAIDEQAVADHAQRQERIVAKDAFSICGVGPGPLMNLVEHLCGPENTVFHMHDEPALFAEVLEGMHGDRMRYLRAMLPHLKADSFWLTENTSTSLISPTMFRDFCMPHLRDYGQAIKDAGVVPVHHMCGTLNELLEMIDELPALVNEAYTTRPLGSVSLAEGRTRMPSKALIGGTNATLWLASVDEIVQTVERDLSACPDRRKIFLTSAGVLPAPVSFDKARAVVERFKRLPAA